MSKKKNYYLIVSSSDIHEKETQRGITIIDHKRVSEIFDSYGIPKEYQKVVIKISLKNNIAKELLSSSIYLARESVIKSILNNGNNIILETIDNVIDTKLSIYNIDKVREFYQAILDNKLAVNYKKAIKEVYKYHYQKENNNKLRKVKRNEYTH